MALCFGVGVLRGAPFLPVRRPDAKQAIELAGLQRGQTVVDLGSGDGAFLAAAARQGVRAIGYEINPLLAAWSWVRTRKYGRLVSVRWGDYWLRRLPPADAVFVFGIEHWVPRLERKVLKELRQETLIISYIFELPKLQRYRSNRNTFIYFNRLKVLEPDR